MKESSWLDELWFSPSWVFMKYIHLLRQIDFNEDRVRREGRFKKVREALAAANLAMAVQTWTNQPVYMQLSEIEPPDFFLFQRNPDAPDTPWITYVEHTSYGVHPSQTDIAKQLRDTKLATPPEGFSVDYILLIQAEQPSAEDLEAVAETIRERQVDYKVWVMTGRMEADDELIRVAAFNSPFDALEANAKFESERFSDADPAFALRTSPRDERPAPEGQPAPWPDPFA